MDYAWKLNCRISYESSRVGGDINMKSWYSGKTWTELQPLFFDKSLFFGQISLCMFMGYPYTNLSFFFVM